MVPPNELTRRSRTSASGEDMLAKIRMLIHEVDEQKLTRVEKLSIPLMAQHESCSRIIMNLII
jgi:hypothetical protein